MLSRGPTTLNTALIFDNCLDDRFKNIIIELCDIIKIGRIRLFELSAFVSKPTGYLITDVIIN